MDAANMLKPLLARGELRMVGATTLAEYRKIERDGALARRFSAVMVEEPSVEETVAILRGLRGAYEEPPRLDDRRRGARRRGAAVATATSPSTTCPTRRSTWSTRPPRACAWRGAAGPTGRAERASCAPRSRPRSTPRPTRTPAKLKRRSTSSRPRTRRDGPPRRPRRRRGRGRRGRRRAHRHPRGRAGGRRARAPAGARERPAPRVVGQDEAVEVVADTIRRARVGLSEGDRPLGHASCSSARPASARPSSSRRSPSGCSPPRRRSCASTCPSTASRTRWRA